MRGHIGFLFMFSIFQNQFLSSSSLARPSLKTIGLDSWWLRFVTADATLRDSWLSLDHACALIGRTASWKGGASSWGLFTFTNTHNHVQHRLLTGSYLVMRRWKGYGDRLVGCPFSSIVSQIGLEIIRFQVSLLLISIRCMTLSPTISYVHNWP